MTFEQIHSLILAATSEAIRRHSVNVGNYYKDKIEKKALLSPADMTLIDFISRRLPRGTCLLDVGTGLGQLPIALAILGYPTFGIDLDEGRIEIAKATHKIIAAAKLPSMSAVVLAREPFPITAVAHSSMFGGRLPSVLITQNVIGMDPNLITCLADYPRVIMNMTLFDRVRLTAADIEDLEKTLAANKLKILERFESPTEPKYARFATIERA